MNPHLYLLVNTSYVFNITRASGVNYGYFDFVLQPAADCSIVGIRSNTGLGIEYSTAVIHNTRT